MAKHHQTQHRPQRDEQRGRELADLKKINNQLQRQVLRLRKELARIDLTDDESDPMMILPDVPNVELCIKCETPMKELTLGPSVWIVCPTCQNRRKI